MKSSTDVRVINHKPQTRLIEKSKPEKGMV